MRTPTLIKSSLALATLAIGGITGQHAAAQASDWSYTGTVYLYGSATTSEFRDIETELSFSDALENLDFAFMGAFEASNGTWSFITDYMLTDLSFSDGISLGGFDKAETSVRTQILSAYGAYRVYDDRSTSIDVGAGLRWYSTETDFKLKGDAGSRSTSVDNDWVDPLIMVRARTRLADQWFGAVLADYGGFTEDSYSSQITVSVGYELTENWVLQGGYRYIDINRELDRGDYSFSQSGPIFGASYRF